MQHNMSSPTDSITNYSLTLKKGIWIIEFLMIPMHNWIDALLKSSTFDLSTGNDTVVIL